MAKKTTKKVGAISVKNKDLYTASLKILGREFKSEADSIELVLKELKPVKVRSKSVLKIGKGDSFKERVLTPYLTHRLFFASGLTRDIAIKNTVLLFQGL